MPLTVFDIKGISGHRRERIEAAVVAGGKYTTALHEAWIAADDAMAGSGCSSRGRTTLNAPRRLRSTRIRPSSRSTCVKRWRNRQWSSHCGLGRLVRWPRPGRVSLFSRSRGHRALCLRGARQTISEQCSSPVKAPPSPVYSGDRLITDVRGVPASGRGLPLPLLHPQRHTALADLIAHLRRDRVRAGACRSRHYRVHLQYAGYEVGCFAVPYDLGGVIAD